jgi:hypothetical protein
MTAIDTFARRYGVMGVDAFERLRKIIRALDSEYLKITEERAKRPALTPMDEDAD